MNVYFGGLLIFFLTAASFAPFSRAADPGAPVSQQAKLKKLQEQLDRLKTMNAAMFENQAKIKSELEILRVWIRRQS